MKNWEYVLLIYLLCGLAGAMVLVPLALYLLRPWATRRDKLLSNLTDQSLMLYYRQFYPSFKPTLATVIADFKEYFHKHFGRRFYVLPTVLLATLTIASVLAAARTLQVQQRLAPATSQYALPVIVVAALAGGFTWVINDLIGRLRRRDLTVSDVYSASFRILLSVPFGWAFSELLRPGFGVPLAFLLGVFPTGTLFKIGRRLAAQKLGVSDDPESGTLELERLQSISKTNAERFYDEGISTMVQLAYADPIDLTIRTNFDFNYVIDCISQALLWIYLEDKARALASYSFRGAQEVSGVVHSLRNPKRQAQATATINAVASILNMPPVSLQSTLNQVSEDPYTRFICSIWH